jgi:peptidoglycan/xylan/chitin deacetylase (PgdA/CDA1 family)
MKILFLKLCRAIGLFRLANRVNRKKLCILCYHGFAENGESAFGSRLLIERDTFAGRLEHLKKTRRPVLPLDEAVKRLESGSLPDGAVAITIDDGFYSTYLHAAPLLKAYGFPATVYVTSYYVRKKTPIYQLFVQYAFWKTAVPRLREREVISAFDGEVDLKNEAQATQATERFVKYGEMRSIDEQVATARRLGDALQVPYARLQSNRLLSLMTEEEIEKLRDYGIDVQLHTHRHRLPPDRETVLREIDENRNLLAPLSSSALQHLCYPSGIWSPQVWPWLREAGIATATTCDYGLNDADTDMLALRRFLDGEGVSSVEFEAAISGFVEWLQAIKDAIRSVRRWARLAPMDGCEMSTGVEK